MIKKKKRLNSITPLNKHMKKVILFILLILIKTSMFAQSYEVLNYNFNSTPVNGVKIKTNIPYTNGSQMPTIHITGYNYGTQNTIGLDIVWYIYGGEFINYGASSSGGYTPAILLSNENGKVVIFINDKSYYQRFKVSVFAQGMSEAASWFTGWTVADETLNGTNTVQLTYTNKLGNLTVNGNIGIGTATPGQSLEIYNPAPLIRYNRASSYTWEAGVGNGTTIPLSYFVIRDVSMNQIPFAIAPTTGNVGIGTSAPKAKLDVNGNIYSNGKIFIGMPDANTLTQIANYSLAVNGTAVFNKAKVSLYGNWPDYVFSPSYKLTPLDSIEQFITVNGHLPEMPKAKEVEKNGIDLGETQALLLKKIEELTLFAIEQNKQSQKLLKIAGEQAKQSENLQKTIDQQNKKIEEQSERISDLEKNSFKKL
jgi:hypothetical protein